MYRQVWCQMTGNRASTAAGDTLSLPRNLAGALRLYPEYKESGVEWLGQVPKHWALRKMKYLFSEKSSEGVS